MAGELPIFELPVVLLPGELMPLHIFEERYKRMIGHCLETEEPFGIVFRDDDGSARRIGCTARVTEVLERFDDGRMDIVVTGEEPFRVLERFEAEEYPAGEVETVGSTTEPMTRPPPRRRAARSPNWSSASPGTSSRPRSSPQRRVRDRSRVELPVETKQRLLELRSEDERMRTLGAALDTLIETLARSREIAERAKMNGKVVFG